MENILGIYENKEGNTISIYNETKTYEDGRDCYMIQGENFRTNYSEEKYKAILKDGYKKI